MDWHYSILWIVLIFKLTCGEYCLRTLDTVRDVSSCPRNKEEWEAAAKRKDCSHVKTGNCENVTYHCLRDAVTKTMVEVCTVPKNLPGRCPLFYRDPPYVRNDYDRDCRNSSRCPDFYSSKDAYNYSACYNDSSLYTFGIAKGTEKSNNWILVFLLVILFLLIVVYIIAVIWVKKSKRISLRKALCIHQHILQECRKDAQDGKKIEDFKQEEEKRSLISKGSTEGNNECRKNAQERENSGDSKTGEPLLPKKEKFEGNKGPLEPKTASQPGNPSESEDPVEPKTASQPETPSESEDPVEPKTASQQETPSESEDQVEPKTKSQPETPSESEDQVELKTSSQPETSSESEDQEEPKTGSQPETSPESEGQVEPKTASQPETPSESEGPSEPKTSLQPETPSESKGGELPHSEQNQNENRKEMNSTPYVCTEASFHPDVPDHQLNAFVNFQLSRDDVMDYKANISKPPASLSMLQKKRILEGSGTRPIGGDTQVNGDSELPNRNIKFLEEGLEKADLRIRALLEEQYKLQGCIRYFEIKFNCINPLLFALEKDFCRDKSTCSEKSENNESLRKKGSSLESKYSGLLQRIKDVESCMAPKKTSERTSPQTSNPDHFAESLGACEDDLTSKVNYLKEVLCQIEKRLNNLYEDGYGKQGKLKACVARKRVLECAVNELEGEYGLEVTNFAIHGENLIKMVEMAREILDTLFERLETLDLHILKYE